MSGHLVCDCDVIHEEAVREARKKMPPDHSFGRLAELYKMFSDGTRVRIMWALRGGEMCVCDLAALLNMTKSAISHQLKPLRLLNLIKFRKEGRIVYYSLADSHVEDILDKGFEHINE